MNIFKQILILGLFLILSQNSDGRDRYTNYVLFGGAAVNLNIHTSDFSSFPACPSCAEEFNGGYGIAPQFTFGGMYLPESKLFGREWRVGMSLNYSNLSATMIREEFIGYVIYDDSYTEGKSEFTLDGDISALLFAPFISIQPAEIIPLRIDLGLEAGFYLNSTFSHKESLLSPEGATYENYKRVRQEFSGEIPDVNSLYLSGRIGLSYEVYSFDDLVLVANLNYAQGFNDFTQAVDWNGSRFFAGANVEYRIPAPSPPAPTPPPPPPLPEPEQPEPLVLDIKLEYSGKNGRSRIYNEGDTLILPVNVIRENELIALDLRIYITDDMSNISKKGDGKDLYQKYTEAYRRLPNAIAEKIKRSKEDEIIITANFTDERTEVKRKVRELIEELNSMGIDEENIKIQYNDLSRKDYRYTELKEEANNIEVDLRSTEEMLYIERSIDERIEIEERIVKIVPEINKNDIKSIEYFSTLDADDQDGRFELNKNNLGPVIEHGREVTFSAEVTDISGQNARDSIRVFIAADKDTTEKLYKTFERPEKAALGYFKFDRSSFDFVDQRVLEHAKEKARQGRKIIIYAYTDNLGSEEYNDDLARKRAKAAIDVLNIDPSQVRVIYPKTPPFNNASPLGRKLNRSVFIEIE